VPSTGAYQTGGISTNPLVEFIKLAPKFVLVEIRKSRSSNLIDTGLTIHSAEYRLGAFGFLAGKSIHDKGLLNAGLCE
jgi:hypothetical protein